MHLTTEGDFRQQFRTTAALLVERELTMTGQLALYLNRMEYVFSEVGQHPVKARHVNFP